MNRQHALALLQVAVPELGLQVQRNQRRLPVVAVDDVRNPFQIVQRRQRSLGEIAVLRNILPEARIGIAPVEEFTVVDEVVDDAVHLQLHDADIEGSPLQGQVHHEGTLVLHLLLVLILDAGIQRENHPAFTAFTDQGPGQRVHYVPQSAGFHKRITFRTYKGDLANRFLFFHSDSSPYDRLSPFLMAFQKRTSVDTFILPYLPAVFHRFFQDFCSGCGAKKRCWASAKCASNFALASWETFFRGISRS